MSFTDDLSEFGKKLLAGIQFVSFWLLKAVAFLADLETGAPTLVQFIIDVVAKLMDRVDAGEITGPEAREIAVSETQAEFHGSGPVIPEPTIRQAVEAAVTVEKARRRKSTEDKDNIAIEKGYLRTNEDVRDLNERIKAGMPLFGD